MPRPHRRIFAITVTVGLLMLAGMGTALHLTLANTRETAAWVAHTHRVLDTLSQVEVAAARLEAGQRGLLATRNEQFRRERTDAIGALESGVAELTKLTSDNPTQLARFNTLGAQAASRIALALRNEGLSQAGTVSVKAAVESPQVLAVVDAMQATIAEIKRDERSLLDTRRLGQDTAQAETLRLLALALMASTLLLAWAYWFHRRQARLQVRAETRFQDLVQTLPVSVWTLRSAPRQKPRFEFISENARTLRHIDPELVLADAEQLPPTIHPEDRPIVAAAMAQAGRTLEPFQLQYRVHRPDGEVRWIQSSARLRRDTDGSLIWSGYWADVTHEFALKHELARMTEEATSATLAKSAFLAAMSHEIRTPMNGVLGLVELLSLTKLDPEQRSTLVVIRDSGRSLLRIVDDILDFSKMEADRLELNPVASSITHVVESACQIHSGMASGKGLLLQARVDPRVSPALQFDPQRLGQILNNLVSNAIKFTERGSVAIDVTLVGRSGDKEELDIVVTDTGVGVAKEDFDRLFQPFVQASTQTASRFGGTGLGLVISRRLAEMMGGTISMHSVLGSGTKMTMRCAFAVAETSEIAEHATAAVPARLEKLLARSRSAPAVAHAVTEGTLILVVDDHPTNRMVLKRQVNSLGYAAESAADGKLAYEAWQSGRFGLIIADCNMPEMSGYDLARAIRRDEEARGDRRIPIIACTANAMPSEAAICAEAGMDDYLVKPTGLEALAERLTRWAPLPTARADAEEPPIDDALLDTIAQNDSAVKAEILADFRRANEADAALLRRCVREADLPQVVHYAHRIRGACMTFGSHELADVCGEIEEFARAGDQPALHAVMATFEAQYLRLSLHLDSLLRRGAPAPS
ncbi:MAG TPA: response regulator [Ramlibacter sp.]|nr:response regulator [Ramlibacter sp.]